MRPLYGVLKPKVKSRYIYFRHTLKKRLYGTDTGSSTNMQSSVQRLRSEDGRDWGLRVPGSQTMKTMNLSVARSHHSEHSESTSNSPWDRKHDGQVAEDWV